MKAKLDEEVGEFIDEPNEEELADILEVIESIKKFKEFDDEKIIELKKKKFEKRGGFDSKIILDEVND